MNKRRIIGVTVLVAGVAAMVYALVFQEITIHGEAGVEEETLTCSDLVPAVVGEALERDAVTGDLVVKDPVAGAGPPETGAVGTGGSETGRETPSQRAQPECPT